jgi:hypothetical protein
MDKKSTEDALDELAAQKFLADPLMATSDLPRPVLRQVLALKGVSEVERNSLIGRQELIRRVQEVVKDSEERVRLSLDQRSSTQKRLDVTNCVFARCFGTNLLLQMAHFLDQRSIGCLASVGVYLRTRLTLCLAGTPSIYLARISHCSIPCTLSRNGFHSLLDRAAKVQSVLFNVDRMSQKRLGRSIGRLHDCAQLVDLQIRCTGNPSLLIPSVSITTLRRL